MNSIVNRAHATNNSEKGHYTKNAATTIQIYGVWKLFWKIDYDMPNKFRSNPDFEEYTSENV